MRRRFDLNSPSASALHCAKHLTATTWHASHHPRRLGTHGGGVHMKVDGQQCIRLEMGGEADQVGMWSQNPSKRNKKRATTSD
ncbi:hypothetical protein IF1G_05772 [Cordyceps javanica]|uniref:Uncharacterized protein n=1 Tax=Cordyceps javanica TaxID=43265 RepID=A0A545V2L7_9HYPO|nr:hypothetical protein IF1G_05772 [Cordyceps javanica]